LGTGEAVVTVLGEKGVPTPVAWTRLRAPQSSMDPAPADEQTAAVTASPLAARYAQAVDRESAYELLTARAEQSAAERLAAQQAAQEAEQAKEKAEEAERVAKQREKEAAAARKKTTQRTSGAFDSLLRSVGTQLGREITRTVFGTRRR